MKLASEEHTVSGASAWVGATQLLQAEIETAAGATSIATQLYESARMNFEGTLPEQHWLRGRIPPPQ